MSQTEIPHEILDDLLRLEEQLEALQERVDSLETLSDRIDEIDARTDMMQLVDDVDDMSGRERSIRLLQHMQRKAERNNLSRIALTRDEADEALHYPEIDRTTLYTDMRRCARLLGDEGEICWYEPSDVGPVDEAQVILDYDAAQAVEDSTVLNGGV